MKEFFTVSQIIAHIVGDYLLQPHYLAENKTSFWWVAFIHGIVYVLPFLFITRSPLALLFISGTHMLIDRYRIGRVAVWLKNGAWWYGSWSECAATGYKPTEPLWLVGWLSIIADNVLHILCNAVAINWM